MTNKDGGPAVQHMIWGRKPRTDKDFDDLEKQLDAMAKDGWEVVSMELVQHRNGGVTFLSRRSTPQPDPVREELVEALESYLSDMDGWGDAEMHRRHNAQEIARFRKAKRALSKAKEGQS